MRARGAVRAGRLRRPAVRLIIWTFLGAALLATSAYAKSPKPVSVNRCGYVKTTYGKSALYPWHMSCAEASKVASGSGNPHAQVIGFGPGWDGGAVRIDGQYWVCTGQMGFYNCGYPYRPQKVKGAQGYRGPFTKDVEYQTCSLTQGSGSSCPKAVGFTQP
jgi:hypothetical protein